MDPLREGRSGARPTDEALMVQGLASTAIALAERNECEVDALSCMLALSAQVGGRTPQVFRSAAAAITAMPLPPVESAEETERARPLRTMLGVQSVEDQITSALLGREWLLRLADELEGRV